MKPLPERGILSAYLGEAMNKLGLEIRPSDADSAVLSQPGRGDQKAQQKP
jgi:hypothetical protein